MIKSCSFLIHTSKVYLYIDARPLRLMLSSVEVSFTIKSLDLDMLKYNGASNQFVFNVGHTSVKKDSFTLNDTPRCINTTYLYIYT